MDQIFFILKKRVLSNQRDYLWHRLTKASPQAKKAQGVALRGKILKRKTRFKAGFGCLLCVGVFILRSGGKRGRERDAGGKMRVKEKRGDAHKAKPGVFVSECVSADVNRVPL